ncbi:MAG: Fur family transcriptional regulator [Candidatus Dormibacteria bacterium]
MASPGRAGPGQPGHRDRDPGGLGEAPLDDPGAVELSKPLDSSSAAVARRLRQHGLRATAARTAVYQALAELDNHPSADEVAEHLRRTGRPLARASAYNGLEALAGAGLILRADAGPGACRYEVGPRWHHHFVCRSCGAVSDVACVVGEKPCLRPDPELGLAVDEAQIIFRGKCAACRVQLVG